MYNKNDFINNFIKHVKRKDASLGIEISFYWLESRDAELLKMVCDSRKWSQKRVNDLMKIYKISNLQDAIEDAIRNFYYQEYGRYIVDRSDFSEALSYNIGMAYSAVLAVWSEKNMSLPSRLRESGKEIRGRNFLEVLEDFPEDEKNAFKLFFGLDEDSTNFCSLEEISYLMECSKIKVRNLIKKCYERLMEFSRTSRYIICFNSYEPISVESFAKLDELAEKFRIATDALEILGESRSKTLNYGIKKDSYDIFARRVNLIREMQNEYWSDFEIENWNLAKIYSTLNACYEGWSFSDFAIYMNQLPAKDKTILEVYFAHNRTINSSFGVTNETELVEVALKKLVHLKYERIVLDREKMGSEKAFNLGILYSAMYNQWLKRGMLTEEEIVALKPREDLIVGKKLIQAIKSINRYKHDFIDNQRVDNLLKRFALTENEKSMQKCSGEYGHLVICAMIQLYAPIRMKMYVSPEKYPGLFEEKEKQFVNGFADLESLGMSGELSHFLRLNGILNVYDFFEIPKEDWRTSFNAKDFMEEVLDIYGRLGISFD